MALWCILCQLKRDHNVSAFIIFICTSVHFSHYEGSFMSKMVSTKARGTMQRAREGDKQRNELSKHCKLCMWGNVIVHALNKLLFNTFFHNFPSIVATITTAFMAYIFISRDLNLQGICLHGDWSTEKNFSLKSVHKHLLSFHIVQTSYFWACPPLVMEVMSSYLM